MLLPSVLFKNFPPTLLRESSLLDASLTIQTHSDRAGRLRGKKINLSVFFFIVFFLVSSGNLSSVCLSHSLALSVFLS